MHLKLYRLFSLIAGPLIDLYLLRRKRNGKEDPKRFQERLGHPGFPRSSGSLVWVHAASVGEVISVLYLIREITEKYPDINVLVTTGTVTSANVIAGRLPPKAFHQYVPIDKIITVRRFLAHWKPDLALWVESELWPNLITETHKTGCPMIQINARISIRSHQKWLRYNELAKNILSCFALSLTQSEDDKTRLSDLGATNTKYVGNLKFDAPALPSDPANTGKLVAMIGDRPMWIAASTHPKEEIILAKVHKKLKESHDSLLMIIIPRHPERGKDILAELTADGINAVLRSSENEITDDTDIYIADTIGELGIFYRLSGIVFMGGSMVNHGGQNPLEAARLECAMITGSSIDNFVAIYSEMEREKAVIKVKDSEDLVSQIDHLLVDHEAQEELSSTALELMKSKKGTLNCFLAELDPYLKVL